MESKLFTLPRRPGQNPAAPAGKDGQSCAICRYFMPHQGQPNAGAAIGGLCRRYPPAAQILGMVAHPIDLKQSVPQVGRALPPVQGVEWCGEYTPDIAP